MVDENENIQEVDAVEVLKEQAALSLITKAEIDSQIATAQAFPRSIKKFLDKAMSLATISEDVAQSCAYALPRAGKTLEGPSVRLAEIVFSSYGNVRGGARIIHNDGKNVTAQGICHDLETNACITIEVKRSILQNEYQNGKRTGRMITMTEDMQVVTGNAACAIAFRNVVFKIIPTAVIEHIYEKVKEVAKGTAETLPARRDKAFKYLESIGVKEDRVFAAIGVAGIQDIDLEKLSLLRGMCATVKNGESTADLVFPDPKKTDKEKGEGLNKSTEDAIKKQSAKAVAK